MGLAENHRLLLEANERCSGIIRIPSGRGRLLVPNVVPPRVPTPSHAVPIRTQPIVIKQLLVLHVPQSHQSHPVHGYSFLSQAAHESTVWSPRHLPQNRDVFMTTGGNGTLELWKYSYPQQRKIKEKDGHDKGVLGEVQLLQKKTFSTQPVASFDWNADKEGLAVMGLLDRTVRVLICTKLNLL